MSIHEVDPRHTAYIALFTAITWYRCIEPEAAWRIATGKSSAKPGVKVTPEIREQILAQMENPNFKSFDAIEKKFKINRYDIIGSEEVLTLGQIEKHLKQIKTITETCNGDCSKCFLDAEISENLTMCEFMQDLDFESPQKPKNRRVYKSKQLFTQDYLYGPTMVKAYRAYKKVNDAFEKYLYEHKAEKAQDIINKALLEYMERHK